MSRIRPTWTPESVDGTAQAHVLGFDFSSDIAVSITGIWWWQPATGGPASVTARLFDQATQVQLGSGTGSGLTAGAWNLVALSAPYDASAGVAYTAAVGSTGGTGYDGNDLAAPIIDPTGHVTIPASRGRFINGTTTAFPTSTWGGMHGVDVEFTSSAGSIAGTVAVVLPALVGGYASSATVAGGLASTLPPIAAQFAAEAVASGTLAASLPLLSANFTQGRALVARPNTGTITRPNTGVIIRTLAGVIARLSTGIIARP